MAEIPKLKLDLPSCSSEDIDDDAFAEKPDSFVIDMDAFSSSSKDNTTNANANSRITRSHSRKGLQRGGDRKVNGNATLLDDTVPLLCSPKGPCTPEKSAVMAVGSLDHVHHEITITASNMSGTTSSESKCITRRNSFRRPSSWALDPKRVLLFFATLSSMGAMLLIYFTLTISRESVDDWTQ
ncbi:uncharacterized protein LOC130741420 [Lotus japonicus]|uniref:uncharacterized protein LOC130741420 n=1 Tax=Lotus japonicus TaxID=34305 RepID=UPI0025840ACF|nr:uncharacterized protein LOC130741420 [Lotus japonicus]